jgi:LPXTG-site transpeptidase (sortase) family protein
LQIKPRPTASASKGQRASFKLDKLVAMAAVFVAAAAAVFLLASHFGWFDTVENSNRRFEQLRNQQLDIETKPVSDQEQTDHQVAANHPRYLTIDAIGVKKARILALGVLKPSTDGTQQLDAPKNVYDVGWYDCRINPLADRRCATPALPGAGDTSTAAMLDGHSCTAQSCVFDDLSKLKPGDKITVELGNGNQINYAVREVSVVKLSDVDMAKMMKPIVAGKEGLNLITCIGNWTAQDTQGVPTMDKRVMVFAARE